MAIELLKQPFGTHQEFFTTVDPMHYHVPVS